MPIVGHRFNKILIERGEYKPGIKVSSNVDLTGVEKTELMVGGDKKKGLNLNFSFTVRYGENSGNIEVIGTMFYVDDPKQLTKLEKQWNKNKKLDDDYSVPLLNRAMELGFMQAIPLANSVQLPAPLRIPRLVKKKE